MFDLLAIQTLTFPSGASDQMSDSLSVLLFPKWNSRSPYFQMLGVLRLCEVPVTALGSPNIDLISSRVQPGLTGEISPVWPNFLHHDLNASQGTGDRLTTTVRHGAAKISDCNLNVTAPLHAPRLSCVAHPRSFSCTRLNSSGIVSELTSTS